MNSARTGARVPTGKSLAMFPLASCRKRAWCPGGKRSVAQARAPYNKALHQTRRGGAVASRPVVEARLAGEGRC